VTALVQASCTSLSAAAEMVEKTSLMSDAFAACLSFGNPDITLNLKIEIRVKFTFLLCISSKCHCDYTSQEITTGNSDTF